MGKEILAVVGLLIVGTVCAAQNPPKQPDAKPAFACPDPEARQACKSYQELVKAKDAGLPPPIEGTFACFRKKVDEFFVLAIHRPFIPKHSNEEAKQIVYDENPRGGFGYAQTYKDGVLNLEVMPSFHFSGKWQALPFSESLTFTSETVNQKKTDPSDMDTGIAVDDTQVSVGYKYENKQKETVIYILTIQKSTGSSVMI